MLKIVFAGTPDFAKSILDALLLTPHQIVGVYTQPDRPAGRGKQLTASPVKTTAAAHNIPVFQPERLSTPTAQAELMALAPDIMVVVAYGLILPKEVLKIPKYGCINVHASLLPRWRGAAPIQRAIEAGDTQTGISIMQMDEGLDTGDVILMEAIPITPLDTGKSVHDKLATLGQTLIVKTLEQIDSGSANATPQSDKGATYAHKLKKVDAKIDWTLTAEGVERKIRAFNPWPVAFTEVNGNPVRIWQACTLAHKEISPPGTIISTTKEGIDVATRKGVIRLLTIQLPGKKPLAVAEVLNGQNSLFEAGKTLG